MSELMDIPFENYLLAIAYRRLRDLPGGYHAFKVEVEYSLVHQAYVLRAYLSGTVPPPAPKVPVAPDWELEPKEDKT